MTEITGAGGQPGGWRIRVRKSVGLSPVRPVQMLQVRRKRRPVTARVALTNRQSGPEKVLDIAAARVRGPGDRIEDLITPEELEEVAAGYRSVAGFRRKTE